MAAQRSSEQCTGGPSYAKGHENVAGASWSLHYCVHHWQQTIWHYEGHIIFVVLFDCIRLLFKAYESAVPRLTHGHICRSPWPRPGRTPRPPPNKVDETMVLNIPEKIRFHKPEAHRPSQIFHTKKTSLLSTQPTWCVRW